MNSHLFIKAFFLKTFIFLVLLFSTFSSCNKSEKKEITTAFYHWKSELNLSESDVDYLKECNASLLYIRCFDVKWDKQAKQPIPNAKLKIDTITAENLDFIPVVFLENDVFVNIALDSINSLAKNCYTLILSTFEQGNLKFPEMQFDCDWTEKTKDKYFQFLLEIIRLSENKSQISATIRLHQVKYFDITGIPPVDKGMLMFYNMGKLSDYTSENSIYNAADAKKYVGYIRQYPLRLDFALPIFSWGICFKSGKVFKIINQLRTKDLIGNSNFKSIHKNTFSVNKAHLFKGVYFEMGDRIRIEEITPEICKNAANQLSENLNSSIFNLAFYHLDSTNISIFPSNEIKNIVSTFN